MGLGVDLGPVTFYHVLEGLEPDFPRRVYTADSPLRATCLDASGAAVDVEVMVHDAALSTVRIDRPSGAAVRGFITDYLAVHQGLRRGKSGAATAWLIEARELYAGLRALMRRSITIYSTAEEVAGARRQAA